MAFLTYIRVFLLASWFGAAIFFSAVVAPSAFSALRAHSLPNVGEVAGTIVTRTLAVVNLSGFVISLVLLATALAYRKASSSLLRALELTSIAVIAITTGVGHWVIASKMRALRLAMVIPIDQVAIDDPRRQAFNQLHGYSVAALSVAMIAALVAFVAMARRSSART